MNHNPNENFRKSFLSISMTDSEKNAMKKQLRSLTIGDFDKSTISSPYLSWGVRLQRGLSIAAMSFVVLGVLSQPASAKSLPGEFLYPVKIAHEEIVSVTKFDTESKIKYETTRTERRIDEATQLILENNLNAENQIIIARSIKKHTEKIRETINTIVEQDPIVALELNTHLENTLTAKTIELKEAIIEHPLEETSPEVVMLAQNINQEFTQEIITETSVEDVNNTNILLASTTATDIGQLFDIILGIEPSHEMSPEEATATNTAIATIQGDLEASPTLLVSVLEEGIQEAGFTKMNVEANLVETVITPVAVTMADTLDAYQARENLEMPVIPTSDTSVTKNLHPITSFFNF